MTQALHEHDTEVDLSVTPGCHPNGILVDIDLQPDDARCILYGVMADGHTGSVEVKGGHSQVTLPFVEPRIFVKHLHDFQEIRIGTIGHKDL